MKYNPTIPFLAYFFLLAAPGRAGEPIALPTGRFITPQGTQTGVGTFPANVLASPDGRFLVVTAAGKREFLSVLSTADGRLVSQLRVSESPQGQGASKNGKDGKGGKGGKGKKREKNPDSAAGEGTQAETKGKPARKGGLFYGLAFGPPEAEGWPLYASHGQAQAVVIYHLSREGKLSATGRRLSCPSPIEDAPHLLAGVALDSRGERIYAADNNAFYQTGMRGALLILDTQNGRLLRSVALPGYPFAVAALTTGPLADKKVYVSGERDGLVSVIDPDRGNVIKELKTGSHPNTLLLDRAQRRLFVANGDSDTVSVIDTARDEITDTILLRPEDARGLPGAVPTGLALAPGERRLYVTLGEMNAVAAIDLPAGVLAGFMPVGWYPTAAAVTPDGRRLMVANAKGVLAPNPNKEDAGPEGAWGKYILELLEGTVSTFALPGAEDLERQTRQTIANCRITPDLARPAPKMKNPGIKHVIYIIKENRGPTIRSSATWPRATATPRCAFSRARSRPTSTPWPSASCCWIIFTFAPRFPRRGGAGPPPE